MWMGQAFLVDTQQTGPLGADKFYSTNWGMLGAMHRLGSGSVMLRTMLSLEPATITERRYPLLFQTGETAFGNPITNAQHPHDFVMELSVQYSHSVGERATVDLYYGGGGRSRAGAGGVSAPRFGDGNSAGHAGPSLGGLHPHRQQRGDRQCWRFNAVRFEASGFHGAEPDENRWNFDFGPMNSYSGRDYLHADSALGGAGLCRTPDQPGSAGAGRRESHHGIGGVHSPASSSTTGGQPA